MVWHILSRMNRDLENLLADESYWMSGQLAKLERATQIPRKWFVYGMIGFLSLGLVFQFAAEMICHTVSSMYPAFSSLDALNREDKEAVNGWLVYWIVFGFGRLFDFLLDKAFGGFHGYWLLKTLLFAWLWSPITNGSEVVYKENIVPFLNRYFKSDYNEQTAPETVPEPPKITFSSVPDEKK